MAAAMNSTRVTRDIALATEAVLAAHIEADRNFMAHIETALVESNNERRRMHQENRLYNQVHDEKIDKLGDRIGRIERRFDIETGEDQAKNLTDNRRHQRLTAWAAAMIAGGFTLVGTLMGLMMEHFR
jgi:hypothetical protein